MDTIIQRLIKVVNEFPENVAQMSKDTNGVFQSTTYKELLGEIKTISAGLHYYGVKREEAVGCICDNRKEWALLDFGLNSLGAFNVPRGCDIMSNSMTHILGIPECSKTILENEQQLKKLLEVKKDLPELNTIILIDPIKENSPLLKEAEDFTIITFDHIIEQGKIFSEANPLFFEEEVAKGDSEALATIIFTTGTTGEPKGVMLSNSSFVQQSKNMQKNIPITSKEIWMTILPIWHSFERAISYIGYLNGNTIAYSKPLGSQLLSDLKTIKPTIMSAVPRVWEAIYSGVIRNIKSKGKTAEMLFNFFLQNGIRQEGLKRKILGRNFQFRKPFPLLNQVIFTIPYLLLFPCRWLGNVIFFNKIKKMMFSNWYTGISGGGALPSQVDNFFSAAGILVIDGYGLTEAGPFISGRETFNPVSGGVGVPIDNIEIKVVDVEKNDAPVKVGERGVLMVRGPQIMKGYYKKPELTEQIIRDGWLDTGDIVVIDRRENISIVGRAKDTIVLLSGENIEPVPIEKKICESPYIDCAVVVGDDSKSLSALIVPDFKIIEEYAKEKNLSEYGRKTPGEIPEICDLLFNEVSALVSSKNHFAQFERVYKITILPKSFEVGKELSAKLELLRPPIYEIYKDEIRKLTGK